jgi:hypothetical protein
MAAPCGAKAQKSKFGPSLPRGRYAKNHLEVRKSLRRRAVQYCITFAENSIEAESSFDDQQRQGVPATFRPVLWRESKCSEKYEYTGV